MQPADLVGNRLLRLHLNRFIDGCPDVIAFDGRHNLFNLFSHILRIDRDDLIPVFTAQFALILQLKPVKSDKFIVFIAQAGISIYFFHRGLNIFVNIQTAGGFERLDVTDRLHGYCVFVIMSAALLDNFQTRIFILVLHKVGHFL
ncbi:hypothetical protein D3C71_1824960 [compost metagenome]